VESVRDDLDERVHGREGDAPRESNGSASTPDARAT